MQNGTPAQIEVTLLDMGNEKYGDCILVSQGDKKILIDGGHRSDFRGQDGYQSIPEQLEELLGSEIFEIDLLIVTHCHSDHIGCLPDMVASGILKPRTALVAYENFGFGRSVESDANIRVERRLPTDLSAIVAALREEDRSSLNDQELMLFLQDAATLEQRYDQMLDTLTQGGTKILRYGKDDIKEIEQQFASFQLKILGPSQDHLVICAEAVSRANTDSIAQVINSAQVDASLEPADIYRRIVAHGPSSVDTLDRPGKGAALNDQSIVISIGTDSEKLLLAGDMQFAKPEVRGLEDQMDQLKETVSESGPYRFAKLSHHTSYNGIDEAIWEDFGRPRFLAHTGGLNDATHPDPNVLGMLKSHSSEIKLARTDRNGQISYVTGGTFTKSRGRFNDFTPNGESDPQVKIAAEETLPSTSSGTPTVESNPEPAKKADPEMVDILFIRLPLRDGKITIGNIPISFEFDGGGSNWSRKTSTSDPQEATSVVELTRGSSRRNLTRLLCVTSSSKLENNVGSTECARALKTVRDSGMEILDISDESLIQNKVRNRIARGDIEGVLLLGGYDVVPSERIDVLGTELRREIGSEIRFEPDSFIVWSDDIYGDCDGDNICEIPVSRIPDGKSSDLLSNCLKYAPAASIGKYGIRNKERPFADGIWSAISGSEGLEVSAPFKSTGIRPGHLAKTSLYFMLHGSDTDGKRFWGEDEHGAVEAINVNNINGSGVGVVLAGCCWGALTVDQIACNARGAVSTRTPEQSMALSLLRSGAQAFVGCTGAHYSPNNSGGFFGGPMHRAFWTKMASNLSPAKALFEARKDYLAGIPHGMTKPYHIGIERKIYKQFTCLGYGW